MSEVPSRRETVEAELSHAVERCRTALDAADRLQDTDPRKGKLEAEAVYYSLQAERWRGELAKLRREESENASGGAGAGDRPARP